MGLRDKEKKMKKIISVIAALLLCTGLLAACGSTGNTPAPAGSGAEPAGSSSVTPAPADDLSGEITVYAAASLTESMDQIIEAFEKEHPNVTVTPNYGSSGTLVDQIIEGAPCDVFVSAAQKQMNMIDVTADAEKNPDGNDFVVPDTRIDLLENKCVLAVPEGNPANIQSFDDLKASFDTDGFLFAMGGESVPVGAYTQKIFESLGLDEGSLANAGEITYGEDVKGVTSALTEGTAQAGVIYASDAYSAGLDAVAVATEEQTGGKVIYPAAQITSGTNPDAAKAFLEFLTGPEAKGFFEGVGFTALF